MQGQAQAEKLVRELGIGEHVLLLPYLDQHTLWRLFARSVVYVSLSSHDGTPNTFLEALACGSFPVVGDIASLREWLTHGENGLLVNPKDVRAASEAVKQVLKETQLRQKGKKANAAILSERAAREKIRSAVVEFFDRLM